MPSSVSLICLAPSPSIALPLFYCFNSPSRPTSLSLTLHVFQLSLSPCLSPSPSLWISLLIHPACLLVSPLSAGLSLLRPRHTVPMLIPDSHINMSLWQLLREYFEMPNIS